MTSKGYKRVALPPHRRLTARSVVASILLGLDPPELRTAALVSGAEVLGVNPGTARVAISRMVAADELEATDTGYRLRGHLLTRQTRQGESRLGAPLDWDGTWLTRVVPAEVRTARDRLELRRAMAALRFGELRDGVWLRPHNLPAGRLPDAEAVADRATVAIHGTVDGGAEVAAQLWDLDRWAGIALSLLDEMGPFQVRLDEGDATALAESFVLAAATLRHLQADPLLPTELVGPDWPGATLRHAQDRFEDRFREVLRDWHRSRRAPAG